MDCEDRLLFGDWPSNVMIVKECKPAISFPNATKKLQKGKVTDNAESLLCTRYGLLVFLRLISTCI